MYSPQKGEKMKKRIMALLAVMVLGSVTMASAGVKYKLDYPHTSIGFKVKHLGISSVKGKFDSFDGELQFDGEKLVSLEGKVEINSVNTGNEKRDTHLKSDDFFSANTFPSMMFKSTKITHEGDDLSVVGELTIRDVTKVVTLKGEFNGFADMEMNGMKMKKTGLALQGSINRKDFGLAFNMLNGAGNKVVDDKVNLTIEIEGNMDMGM